MEQNHLTIGMTAPDFTENSTFGPLTMSDYKGKWLIFFSHPGDFTPVCTTEFIAFAKAYDQFKELNADLVGLSIDSNPSHLAWVNDIYLLTGTKIPFPVVADRTGRVAALYGMVAPDASTQETVRNVFFIDPDQKIRAIFVYPLTNGRYIPEVLRLLKALQTTDKYKVVTPANWQPGEQVLVPPAKTVNELDQRASDPQRLGLECMDWFWCYKDLPNQRSVANPMMTSHTSNTDNRNTTNAISNNATQNTTTQNSSIQNTPAPEGTSMNMNRSMNSDRNGMQIQSLRKNSSARRNRY